jgi:beta-phosphoglucomutase
MIKGVLFDMDGVLVDTERYICEAAIKMFAERGVKVEEEDFIPFVGAGENKYVGGVAEKYGVKEDINIIKARTYEIYGQIVKGRLQPLDGVHDFIKKCKAKGLKLAVATSADRIKMEINLREIGLPENTFNATINGLEVERKKPFPDIFISAAKKIGLDAYDCLVVEDAVNGVEAAKAAGAHVLGLTTSFTKEQLAKADWIAPNLAYAPQEAISW